MIQDNYLKTELYDAMRTDDRFFSFLEEASLDGLWYWDLENLENEWMSPTFWRLFGVDPATKTHHAAEWQDIIHPEDLATALENFNKHLEDPDHPYDQIVRYRHADGSTVTVRCRGLIIRDDVTGKPLRMLGAHNDLTELEQTRAALADANDGLADELKRSEMLSAAKTAFMSMMSHEIRTPLNAVIGLFELIASTSDEAKQVTRAQKGLQASQQLYATLSTLLDAAKLEGRAVVPRAEMVSTADLINRLRAVVEGIAQRHGFGGRYSISCDDTLSDTLFLDAGIVLQILTNLADNAIKFSADAPVAITFAPAPDAAQGWLRIRVVDQGIGIEAGNRARVFDPFFQVDQKNVRKIGGTGLGLSIVKQLVETLAGRIELTPNPPGGTCITIDVPMHKETLEEGTI